MSSLYSTQESHAQNPRRPQNQGAPSETKSVLTTKGCVLASLGSSARKV
jgi:hypothetical protein